MHFAYGQISKKGTLSVNLNEILTELLERRLL